MVDRIFPEKKPRYVLHEDWLRGKLEESPERCGRYLMAAAKDSKEMFLIALKNIADAYKVSLKGAED